MPALDTTPEGIRLSLNRKSLAAARQRTALAALLGLSLNDVLAIELLAQAGKATPSALGRLIGLSSGGTAALVARLEREGLVARDAHPSDRRSALLRLTPEVQHRAGDALAPLVEEIDALAAELGDGERRAVARFLAAVAQAAEQHAEALLARARDERAPAAVALPAPGLFT